MQKLLILISLIALAGLRPVDAQTYPKAPGVIRLLTYNTHYGKGGGNPGVMNDSNIVNLGRVIRALDADIISLQELDSASQGRGNRYLLRDIAQSTGLDYADFYGNAQPFDKNGSIGCGALVKKNLPVKSRYVAYLPGDEGRAAVELELDKFVFIATHSDLHNEKRKQGAKIICNDAREMDKPVFVAGDLNDSFRWSGGGYSFPVFARDFVIASDTVGSSIPGRADDGGLIDFILLSKKNRKKIKIVDTHIVRTLEIDGEKVDLAHVSDHYPVFVDIICR